MREAIATRYAVLFIVLVLGQEFCCARILHHQSLKERSNEKREIQEEDHALEEAKNRQKRVAAAVVLLTVTFTTSAVAVGFEIFNTVKGCCGIYPDACTYAQEIERYTKEWENKTKVSDNLFLEATNMMEDILQHNNKVNEILVNLESISNNLDELTKFLSPTTPDKFERKWNEIEEELKKGNTTVALWSYNKINLQFASFFDSPQHALYGLSNFLGQSMAVMYSIASHNYLKNYQAKHIKRLTSGKSLHQLINAKNTKAAKVIGLDNLEIKDFAKKVVNSRIDAKYGPGKYAYLLNAYTIISAAWSLGSDAYRIYASIQQCKDKRDALKTIYDYWKKADDEMNNVIDYTRTYIANLTEGWNYVKSNLTDPNLIKSLQQAKDLSQAASPQTPRLQQASQHIGNYIAHIQTKLDTDPNQAYTTEKNLVEGLMTVKLLTQCYNNRLGQITFVSKQCQTGVDSLGNISSQAMSLFKMQNTDCEKEVGVKSITLKDMETMVDARSSVENYNKDCILNNENKKKDACRLKYDGYDVKNIANKLTLTESQVQHFTNNCPAPPLTDKQKKIVCRLRSEGDSDADILMLFPGYTVDDIAAVMCS